MPLLHCPIMKNVSQSEWDKNIAVVEEKMVRSKLRELGGNAYRASRELGISYPTFRDRMEKFGVKMVWPRKKAA